MTKKPTRLIALLFLCAAVANVVGADLEEGFRNPPEETKPWCYWYWLNGDITEEGITKDLEAMATVGIKRAMIGNISMEEGPVKMFSPEWYALTRHALKEASRLSVELMSFNAPGWSQSGGPWIKPEQSMRRVSWKEFPARGGAFSEKVRPDGVDASQDIAVLAVPQLDAVAITGSVPSSEKAKKLSLAEPSWIWHPADDANSAPAATRYFRRVIQADPATLDSATVLISADNSYVLTVNGQEVLKDDNWKTQESASIREYLNPGANVVAVAVTNTDVGPAGLIAALELKDKTGVSQRVVTDDSWLVGESEVERGRKRGFLARLRHPFVGESEAEDWREGVTTPEGWLPARVLGPMSMRPWGLRETRKNTGSLKFRHTKPFTARALVVHGEVDGSLYALEGGERKLIVHISTGGSNGSTDFLPNGIETFSFEEVTAREFELVPNPGCEVVLTSEPKVAQVIEKQLGRMHPTPSPTWDSYIFPDTVEPDDSSTVVSQKDVINLTDKVDADGTLTCTLPGGDWTILYFGMVSTGKKNRPAPPEATGLECDKLSKAHAEHHFNAMFGKLLEEITPAEKAAFKGITTDSYEVGAQNWTDGFAEAFEKRTGYNPISLLPVMTGRVVDSAKTSDQFLWDLRRTVADMIAENYVGGLRDIAHEHGLTLWCENYGHWGFPGEFLVYGGYADEIGGEFWTTNRSLGTIECRAASSACHIYGKRRVYSEAFTSGLHLGHHPYIFKARGEELFCEGANHFVLHVYAHQPQDGVPGKNPWFGTAFHRNTPWFMQSRDWVKYVQRCHYMLQQGEPVADVAVYIGDFAPQMTGPPEPIPLGYDYDYIGTDAILRRLRVVDGEWVVFDEHDATRIAARWKVLAMPRLKHVRPHVLKRLEDLKRQGGRIVESVPVSTAMLQDAGIAPIVTDTSCPLRWKVRRLDDGMMFFLSNFEETGTFEATLRVEGKAPELFNPVSGEIRKQARFKSVEGGTRITMDVKDKSDSCFVVFRDKPSQPSVVAVTASPADLDLFYDQRDRLTAETVRAGTYNLTLSDGTERTVVVEQNAQTFAIEGPWQATRMDEKGYSVVQETTFDLPAGFGEGQRVSLDLGDVTVMAKVTLNGKTFDTLWMPPFTLDVSDVVKAGKNVLQVLVTSTSEGQPTLGTTVQLKTTTRKTILPNAAAGASPGDGS